MPLAGVNGLTEYELTLWMARGPLWTRRIELMLVQLTHAVAVCGGMKLNGREPRESDFDMFNKKQVDAELDAAANDIGGLMGVGVRKLGQGRK